MMRSILTREKVAIALTAAVLVASVFDIALSADHKDSKSAGWKERQHETEAHIQAMEQRVLQLKERRNAVMKEIKSPDRERPMEELLKELKTLIRELEEADEQLREAGNRRDRIITNSVKSRSVVMAGTAGANAVLERLYPEFIGTLEPGQVRAFPPQLFYEPDGSDAGIERLLAGKAEVAVLDRPLTEEEQRAVELGFADVKKQPEHILFYKAVLAIVVHKGNRVRGLTIDQVEDIYRQKIDNWSSVSTSRGRIDRIGTVYPCLSWWMFLYQVLDGKKVEFPERFLTIPDRRPTWEEVNEFHAEQRGRFPGHGPFPRYTKDAKVIEEVSRNPRAIGYCILLPAEDAFKTVRLTPIARNKDEAPFPPTQEHILLDEYPLQKTIWFLASPNASAAAEAFVKFACSEAATEVIEQCGLHPVTKREGFVIAQRVAAFNRGEGTPVSVCGISTAAKLMNDLTLKYVEAEATVQLGYQDRPKADAVRDFLDGRGEMLLLDGTFEDDASLKAFAEKWTAYWQEATDVTAGEGDMPANRAVTLGRMAVGIVVHPENSLEAVNMDELAEIFAGKIRRWPGAEGPEATMRLFGLHRTSAIARVLDERLELPRRKAAYTSLKDTNEVILTVARDPAAIGFVDLSAMPEKETAVKLVGLILSKDTTATPRGGYVPDDYPLAVPYTLYVSPKASETARAMVKFLATNPCAETLAQYHLLSPSVDPTAAAEAPGHAMEPTLERSTDVEQKAIAIPGLEGEE